MPPETAAAIDAPAAGELTASPTMPPETAAAIDAPAAGELTEEDVHVLRSILRKLHRPHGAKKPSAIEPSAAEAKAVQMLRTEACQHGMAHRQEPTPRKRKRRQDEDLREQSGICAERRAKLGRLAAAITTTAAPHYCPSTGALPVPTAPPHPPPLSPSSTSSDQGAARTVHLDYTCYICKQRGKAVDHYYDRICPGCGELNRSHRTAYLGVDLTGKLAVVTGGRIKIGFEIVVQLLAAGCRVVATTRFPHDAAARHRARLSAAAWDRLQIIGLDLRSSTSIALFTQMIKKTHGRVDILINNAAQTIRRPPSFHAAEIALEVAHASATAAVLDGGSSQGTVSASIAGESAPDRPSVPDGVRPAGAADTAATAAEVCHPVSTTEAALALQQDEHGQPLDLRPVNSWTLQLEQVEMAEVAEVQLINYMAPFQLLRDLHAVLARDAGVAPSVVVNVSSMEGKFYDHHKRTAHPHTNAAKAALNMTVRTSSPALLKDGILLTAVDTGWVTEMNPNPGGTPIRHAPLDEVDGAARVLHPVLAAYRTDRTEYFSGVFLKDYKVTTW